MRGRVVHVPENIEEEGIETYFEDRLRSYEISSITTGKIALWRDAGRVFSGLCKSLKIKEKIVK
jgi:hypothetical protein